MLSSWNRINNLVNYRATALDLMPIRVRKFQIVITNLRVEVNGKFYEKIKKSQLLKYEY